MNKETQDRIMYHIEALKISNEKAAKDIAFLEKYKNYKPKLPIRRCKSGVITDE